MAISENMKVTEWFTRVDANTINYKFTVDDPATWTKPWTAEYPFVADEGPDVRACVPRGQPVDDQCPDGRSHGGQEGRRSREEGFELTKDAAGGEATPPRHRASFELADLARALS